MAKSNAALAKFVNQRSNENCLFVPYCLVIKLQDIPVNTMIDLKLH